MSKPDPRQLRFVFADSPQGGAGVESADVSAPKAPAPLKANHSQRSDEASPMPADDLRRLLELVTAPGNLASALDKVVRNKGAPGVDQQTVKEVARSADQLLPKLRDALLSETYVPGDIRRVWIPKPNGGQRALGIPNVVDRVVQQAMLQILELIYEPTFHPSSHGFRPGRGTRTAIAEAVGYVTQGLRYTVDIDLASFFDRVNHQRLLDRMAQQVPDRRILRLVRLMLKAAVVLPDGTRVATEEGTPQGGPLSPLLSNIVLDELDQELARRGHHFVRYADDCNIYVRSERAGQRVMAAVRRFIERRLRLKVNDDKSAVDLAFRRHFLGFRLGVNSEGQPIVQPSERSLKRLYQRIRELTPRNWGASLNDCMDRIEAYQRGWMGHFCLCTKHASGLLAKAASHLRRRLRAIIVRQKKRPRHLFRDLVRRGVSPRSAKVAFSGRHGAWWISRTNGIHLGYPNKWFARRITPLDQLHRQKRFDWSPVLGTPS